MNLNELKSMSVNEMLTFAQSKGIDGVVARNKRKDIIFQILQHAARNHEDIVGSGVIDVLQEGYGFLRTPESSYLSGPDDIYVSPTQIRRFNLRKGDTIAGRIRPPKNQERFFALLKVDKINDSSPEESKGKTLFENLVPIFPNERLTLEFGKDTSRNITSRMIDLLAPIGKGQRALIVSPPKAGKTMMLQDMCYSIEHNNPECYVIVLLIDERPEEVTDMQRSVNGEVIASTFDEAPARHVQVSEMAIEKAKRLVEHKKDVVLFLDSITRLARAHNVVQPASGRVLTGGLDAHALEKPKRFFGAARNIEGGGSLTIIATSLVETGSKMDDVIYEEFKGTGNMEIHLDRAIANRMLFPAINIFRTSTRRDDLLTTEDELQKMRVLRKILCNGGGTMVNGVATEESIKATEFLIDRLQSTKTNDEFFAAMKRS